MVNIINLLPPRQKDELKEKEDWRLASILGVLVLISLLCFTLILFSIKISISDQVKVQENILSQEEKKIEESQIQGIEEKIIISNQTLSKLNSFYQGQPNFTDVLERISGALPEETYLTALNLSAIPEDEKFLAQISLFGFCPSREILLEFKRNLESEEDFKEVYFPPSNWVEPADIYFSVNFKVSKQ
jgi:Tfp pilus assembly protein PilN